MSKQSLDEILIEVRHGRMSNTKAKAAIVEAVEGLIPPENPELKVDTYVAGLHDGHNNCRKQMLEAIKEWQ